MADLFLKINNTLSTKHLRIYHATRLTHEQGCAISNNGFSPLLETDRIERLAIRIKQYCENRGFSFDEVRFQSLVEEKGNRDNGRVYFSLSRKFHLIDCTEYLHFGSEFEAVIVVWLLGRNHRKLLKSNTNAAFITWDISASEAIDETNITDIDSRLDGGNYPELASFLLNPWLLWKVGRAADIQYLNPDYTLTFKRPLPDCTQSIEWVSEDSIAHHAP
ncbi:MAG: hypothetical protein L3J30_12410 [Marinosulfonomonas sp.]|nr:hypothetical protein [Marinosulfonomonas sp.]